MHSRCHLPSCSTTDTQVPLAHGLNSSVLHSSPKHTHAQRIESTHLCGLGKGHGQTKVLTSKLSSCSLLLSISHPFPPSPGSNTANSHSQSWQWEILFHKGLWTKPGWRQRGIQLGKNLPPPLPGRTVGFAPCQTPNPKRCLPAGRILLKPLIYLITLITQQQRAEITANPSEFGGFISSAQVVFIYSHQSYCLSR